MTNIHYQKIIVLLAMLLVPSIVYAAIDVNIARIDTNPDADVLPVFSYAQDGNLTIDFNVQISDGNYFLFDINYSASNIQGTGTAIVTDANSGELVCDDNNLVDQTACSWDWDISAVADGNYYILIDINVSSTLDFNASDNNFMIDNTAPSTSWDGNHNTWQATDANVHLTCNDGSGSGCGTPYYRVDTDSSSTITYGAWVAYDTNVLINSDGNWAIDFNSTDSAGNIGDTNTMYVLIDSILPVISAGIPSGTVTTQAVTLGVTTSELATCKYSLTDEAYSAMASTVTSSSTTHTWNFNWGANDNGGKTYYVRCADSTTGNATSTSTTITFTLNVASGSGGVVVSSDSGEKANWTNAIRAGYSQKITYTSKDNLVDSIQLFAKNSITRTKLVFDKEVDSIDGVDDSDKLYKYFEITFEGNNEDLEKAEISFRVANAWIKENNYKNQSFVLYRLVDDEWVELDTSYLKQDLEYSYYNATTPGFSYFAILAGEKAPVSDTPVDDDSDSDDSSDNGDDSDGDDSSDDGDSQDNGDASDNGDVTPPVDDGTPPVDDGDVTPPVDDNVPAQDFTGIIILLVVVVILVAVGAYYYTRPKGKNKLAFK